MEKKIIVETIIVLIVVFVVILIPTKGWSIVNYIMNMDKVPETMANTPQQVIDKTNEIFTNYENCFGSKDNNCLCDISFIAFPERYVLVYYDTRLIFTKIKEEFYSKSESFITKIKEIKSDSKYYMETEATTGSEYYKEFQKKDINCYVTYSNKAISIKNPDGNSYLLLESPSNVVFKLPNSDPVTYTFLNKKPTFYKKDNNICFVLEDQLSKEGINYINKLPKCSPKHLNTP